MNTVLVPIGLVEAADTTPTNPTDKDLLVGPVRSVEDLDPVTRYLLDDALAQGRITKQRYASLIRDYEEQAHLRQPAFKFWYDRGFNLGTSDNKFLLRIRGRLATQFTHRDRNEAWRNPGDGKNFPDLVGVFGDYRVNRSDSDAATINLRRARLYFMGHVFDPSMKFYVQIRADSAGDGGQTQSSIQLYDYYVTNTKLDWANVQVGQYKVYFNRAQINSTASMQFAERSLVSDAFTASGLDRRDIGLTIMNDDQRYPLNYYLGVFGGAGPNFTRLGSFESEQIQQNCPGGQSGGVPIPTTDPNCLVTGPLSNLLNPLQRNLNADTRLDINRVMVSLRLNWNIMGRPGYGEGDITYSERPQLAVGGGYAYNPRVNTSTNNAFIGVDLANLNIRRMLAAGGNGRQLGWGVVDYSTWAADGIFKYRGFSLQGEFYYKNVTRREKGRPCVQFVQDVVPSGPFICTAEAPNELGNALGWYVQSGYFLIPRYLEIAGRYSYWDPDTNSTADLIKQAEVSVNWYFSGTYDHSIQVSFSNTAMGTGGYAIGRSNPMPLVNQGSDVYPNGPIPVDLRGGTLVENAVRVQYQIFF
ncbi:MAG: hypothetical protein KF722_15175 [Nitrospira sp.]|nr:hypothetical protein [Nitrospira sp.]